jgi:hypothetical protein
MTLDRDHPLLESIRGIKVLDVDTHLTEVGDLWTSRAPAKYKDQVPRVVFIDNNGKPDGLGRRLMTGQKPIWVASDGVEMGYAGGASVINKENVKIRGSEWIQWPLTEVSAAASYVKPRVEMLDQVGIWGQIVYPNAVAEELQRHGVPAGVCQTAQDRYENDPQLAHLNWVVELHQSEIGTWPIKEHPTRFSETPTHMGGRLNRSGPSYGEDNDYVLGEILGYGKAEIDSLRDSGVL